jgi:hypothetical protein
MAISPRMHDYLNDHAVRYDTVEHVHTQNSVGTAAARWRKTIPVALVVPKFRATSSQQRK